jgi:peptide-methionine (S)-S-oxide reductase
MGDHAEAIQVDYDPNQITYQELLDIFWQGHNPTSRSYSRQYLNAVFYHNDEQEKLARESKERLSEKTGGQIFSEILPASTFYLAEDYHQKYYLQRVRGLTDEFRDIYPDIEGFVDSTAVARVNGIIGGYGAHSHLETEIGSYGLSSSGQNKLLEKLRPR